jgi:predicted nucleotidyltransferase component of viral defense system
MGNESRNRPYHEDADRFRTALGFTESTSGFSARLIEKDYYCSVLLHDLSALFDNGLVFKGGTCLSKVHTEFFRLSEDLDFCLSLGADSSASERRTAVAPFKDHFARVRDRHGWCQVANVLQAHNGSRQYKGRIAYRSVVTGEDGFIELEVSLREEILLPTESRSARTMLLDPDSNQPAFPDVSVRVLSLREAYAEKIRAALTRRKPGIRDFFDIDSAVQRSLFDHRNAELLDLVAKKLLVARKDPVNLSEAKVSTLQGQIEPQLRGVLRMKDVEGFQLQRVVALLNEVVALYPRK